MKKHILYSLLLLVFFSKASAQSDLQWYIHNGYGKENMTDAGINVYSTNCISNLFTLQNVGYMGNSDRRNDIFIIYSDSTYFNSRGLSTYTLNEPNNGDSCYVFNTCETPLYMYYTNLYEGEDDPPLFVKIANGSMNGITSNLINRTYPASPITANHDLKIGKDVTVIINKQFNLKTESLIPNLKLCFNKQFVTPQEEFITNGSSAIFPNDGEVYTNGIDFIELNFLNKTKYKFVNFRVNPAIDSALIGTTIQFHLLNRETGDTIYTHNEKIVANHDPNYIEVLNIFERNPREYWAHMHVQCYNDSRIATVDNTKIALTMPGTVDATTLEMTDWSYASTQGALPEITLTNNGNRVNFNFSRVDDQLAMQGMTTTVDQNQIAWVEYIVKINSSNVEEVAHINLKPLTPMTFFDGTPYNITRFIDRCFGNLSDRNDLCERKIQGPYYMGQFTETLALGSSTPTLISSSGEENNQNCVESHCCKVKCHKGSHKHCCKDKCSKESCEYGGKDKCCKKKKRFWKNVIPWVIAGVMTVIAVAD